MLVNFYFREGRTEMLKRMILGLLVLGLMGMGVEAFGATYLSTVAYPAGAGQPTAFVVIEGTVTGGVFTAVKTYPDSPAKKNADGTAVLWFDTSAMANGIKAVIVKAKNAAGESAATSPFTFTLPVPTIPGIPSGLFLVTQ